MFHVGFTGSQKGINSLQAWRIGWFMGQLEKEHQEIAIHQGNCVGADWMFTLFALDRGYKIYSHPCDIPEKQFPIYDNFEVFPVLPPLERNRVIVAHADILVATPKENHEVLRSGTWATIRYARALNIPVEIFYPED